MAGTEYDFTVGRPLGVTRLDTAYCDLVRDGDGRVRVDVDHPDGTAGVTLWADDRFGYLMVFTGDTLEPEARRTGAGRRADDVPAGRLPERHRPHRAPTRRPLDRGLGHHAALTGGGRRPVGTDDRPSPGAPRGADRVPTGC